MKIKVSSWNKTCYTEWIPNFQANDIWNVISEKSKYTKLIEILGYAGNVLTGHVNVIVWK